MSSLTRTEACGFTIDDALDLEAARKMSAEDVLALVHHVERALGHMPRLSLPEEFTAMYYNGMTVRTASQGFPQNEPIAVFAGAELAGISRFEGNCLKPIKVFS